MDAILIVKVALAFIIGEPLIFAYTLKRVFEERALSLKEMLEKEKNALILGILEDAERVKKEKGDFSKLVKRINDAYSKVQKNEITIEEIKKVPRYIGASVLSFICAALMAFFFAIDNPKLIILAPYTALQFSKGFLFLGFALFAYSNYKIWEQYSTYLEYKSK